MDTAPNPAPSPLLFWKEVEKRNSALADANPSANVSSNKLKINFPPPSESPSKAYDSFDPGLVYGAFNFWKTRDVEIAKKDEERRRPLIAPPKVLKPADETLPTKPQAVRLRFLQKSKSTDSMTLKSSSEPNKTRERLVAYKPKTEGESENKKEEDKGEPQKQSMDKIVEEDEKGGREGDEADDEGTDDIDDPEAVFGVLEEVLEGVLEGDNVTSLVYSKAAHKVKFREDESSGDDELYGGIIINDDKPITRYDEEPEEKDGEVDGEKEEDSDTEPSDDDEKKPDVETNGEVKQETEKEEGEAPKSDIQVDQAQEEKSKEQELVVAGQEKQEDQSDVPKLHAEPEEPKDEPTRKDSTASSTGDVESSPQESNHVESPTKGEPASDDDDEEEETTKVRPMVTIPEEPEDQSSSPNTPSEGGDSSLSINSNPPFHMQQSSSTPSSISAPSTPTNAISSSLTPSTANVGYVSDQIDESIVNNANATGKKGDKDKEKEKDKDGERGGMRKGGSRIIKRAGQLSKFITMRGDKDLDKAEEKKGEKKEEKKQDKDEKKHEKDKKEEKKHEKEKEKEEKKHEKEKEREEKKLEKEKEKETKGEKRKKGSSIFVKRDKNKVPALQVDMQHAPSHESQASPASPPQSPRTYTEGQTFGVEIDFLPYHEAAGVPKFVASAVQILWESEFEDVDYLYFDSETNPKVLPLKALFDTEPLDVTKPYEHVLIAGLLKLFFIELPYPLVPQRLYTNFVDLQEIGEPAVYIGFLRSLVWALPAKHRVLLQFLVKFLRDKYLKNPANSKEYVMNKLGAAFGPILIRSEDATNPTNALASAICRSIITNYESLFENFEGKDSIFVVRRDHLILVQATLERYIDRILDPNYNEAEFVQMFFTIHQIFLTHNALLDLFHSLYLYLLMSSSYINTSQNKTKGNKSWKQAMANRILDILRQWLEFSYFELKEDKALLSRIIRDFPPLEANYKAQHSKEKNLHLNFLSHLGARARAGLSVSNANIPILETSTVELAQHLTMVDFDLFCAVKPIEWLKYTEPFSSPDKKFPHLYAFQRQHSLWEYWTATEILREPHVGLRVLRVAHFIKVAMICRQMNNHCTSLAIIAGLLHPGIRRLDCTWQILTKDMRDIFENLAEWHKAESERSVDEIVTTLQQTAHPFLPSPITLHRLISLLNTLHPLHPTKAPHMLDLDRLRIIYGMMKAFQSILQSPYAMKAVPRLYVQLQEVSVLSGDQLMYKSMICEPPEVPPEQKLAAPKSANATASAGILMSGGAGTYKVPEASNNWKAEVKRIWNKPVEQLPIGIDLPRLATSIFVPSIPDTPLPTPTPTPTPTPSSTEPAAPAESATPAESVTPAEPTTPAGADGDVNMTPAPASVDTPAVAAPVADETDVRARDILHTLVNISRFVEGDEYAQNLTSNFGNFVILDGAKDRDMSREIARLVGEFLGKESKIVKVLKACNQAIIAPAVIELTLNVCAKVPFKDAGGWRMELTKNEEGLITVTHIKQQKQRSSNKEEEFHFEWHLELIFDEAMSNLQDIFLSIPKLNFGPAVSQSTMEGIQYTFAPYLVRR